MTSVTPSVRDAIAKRIAEFLAAEDPRVAWVKPGVRAHGFLPLYLGWTGVLGIRRDGSFLIWNHDVEGGPAAALRDPYWQRLAICQGARAYPELAALVPQRPASAETCVDCGGSGTGPVESVICRCGGAGWVVPGESQDGFAG